MSCLSKQSVAVQAGPGNYNPASLKRTNVSQTTYGTLRVQRHRNQADELHHVVRCI